MSASRSDKLKTITRGQVYRVSLFARETNEWYLAGVIMQKKLQS